MDTRSALSFWARFLLLSLAVNIPLTWALTSGKLGAALTFGLSAMSGAVTYALMDSARGRGAAVASSDTRAISRAA